jgi:hypothetical protein
MLLSEFSGGEESEILAPPPPHPNPCEVLLLCSMYVHAYIHSLCARVYMIIPILFLLNAISVFTNIAMIPLCAGMHVS